MGNLLFGFGYLGVDLFFMISGFVIVYITNADGENNSRDFLTKRFFRVIPLAILGTVGTYLIGGNHDIASLAKSLAFIPLKNVRPPFYGYSVLPSEWTLTYELIFYIVFAASMAVSHRYRTTIASASLIIMIGAMQFCLGRFTLAPMDSPLVSWNNPGAPLVSLLANPIFLEFIAGMFIAEIFSRLPKLNQKIAGYLLAASIAWLLFIYMSTDAEHGIAGIGQGCFFVLLSALIYERAFKTFHVPLPLMKLGEWSYSIYLSHLVVAIALNKCLEAMSLYHAVMGIQKVFLLLTLTLILSPILHTFVERRCIEIGRRVLRNKPVRSEAVPA